jgi:predicted dehydrogenase
LIDQALVLFGRPEAIQADIGVLRDGDGAPDMAHVVLFYDRLRVVLHADMLSGAQPFRFAVHGDRGSVLTRGLDLQENALKAGLRPGDADWPARGPPLEITDGATGAIEVAVAPPGDHGCYYAEVARAIRGNGPNPVSAREALAVMRVLEAGQRSSDEGRRIALDQ